jgi:hypothetical protein
MLDLVPLFSDERAAAKVLYSPLLVVPARMTMDPEGGDVREAANAKPGRRARNKESFSCIVRWRLT